MSKYETIKIKNDLNEAFRIIHRSITTMQNNFDLCGAWVSDLQVINLKILSIINDPSFISKLSEEKNALDDGLKKHGY